jgi:hypothetical protein
LQHGLLEKVSINILLLFYESFFANHKYIEHWAPARNGRCHFVGVSILRKHMANKAGTTTISTKREQCFAPYPDGVLAIQIDAVQEPTGYSLTWLCVDVKTCHAKH